MRRIFEWRSKISAQNNGRYAPLFQSRNPGLKPATCSFRYRIFTLQR
jgi:hypothetical protein